MTLKDLIIYYPENTFRLVGGAIVKGCQLAESVAAFSSEDGEPLYYLPIASGCSSFDFYLVDDCFYLRDDYINFYDDVESFKQSLKNCNIFESCSNADNSLKTFIDWLNGKYIEFVKDRATNV